MAKSENNVLTHGLSGKIGNLLVFRQANGKTIVSAPPRKSNREQSEAQKEHRRKFQQAVLYARAAQAQPEYEAKGESAGKRPYIVAVADFFNAPDVERIDLSGYTGAVGDPIRIIVTDDFAVKSVAVRITNADGSLVEEGAAQPTPAGYEWLFTATQPNETLEGAKVELFASDTPGNAAGYEQNL
jgi:hypothetical protein